MRWLDTDGLDLDVVGLVSGGHFVSHFYLLVFPPLFPILGPHFDLTNVQLGLIMSVIQVGTFLQVFAGDVVDRIGGKRVFVAALVVTALAIGGAGLAGSYLLLVAFALASSVGQAGFHPADYALLDAASDGGTAGKSFAVHSFAGSMGFAAAPLVVGGVALAAGWRTALLVAGAGGLAYAAAAYLLLDEVYLATVAGETTAVGDATEDAAESASERASLRDPTLMALFGFVFLTAFGIVGLQTFTPILASDGYGVGEAAGNTALTAFFTVFAFSTLAGGVLADRFSIRAVILSVIGTSTVMLWGVAAGLVPADPVALVAAFGLVGGVSGLLLPARDRLINAASPAGSTGRSFGFVLTGISLAGVVAPALLGAIIDATDVWTAFWVIGAAVGLGAVITVFVTRAGRVGAAAT